MTSRWAWLFDIGSTFTKLSVVDLDDPSRRHRAQAPTTVSTDVRDGVAAAVEQVEGRYGLVFADAAYRAASSSAAGGLALVVSGLVPRLSAEAGRIAALGAGAKVVGSFAYRLTASDVAALRDLRPDIVLLTGGTDGGDRATLLANAQSLAAWERCPAVIVAGNRDAADDAVGVLVDAGIRATVVPNILPELDRLEADAVRSAIREEFLATIVDAKGIGAVRDWLDADILPTPGVVLEGVGLLAERAFEGEVMAVEVGGATTNVHSYSVRGQEPGVVLRGLPEPDLKRTVEGDLGVRWNATTILELAGFDWFAERGASAEEVGPYVQSLRARPETLPQTDSERLVDELLATYAARTAIARHCGRHREVMTPDGPVIVQEGKDIRRVGALIATGGSVISAASPVRLMESALAPGDPFALIPHAPEIVVDRDYVLYACGLLASYESDLAVALAEASLRSPSQTICA